MSFLNQLRALVEDPAPAYAFEVSRDGVAFGVRPHKRGQQPQISYRPFDAEVLSVSPVQDNVLLPDLFAQHVNSLIPPNGNRRREATVILPDFSARVAVLDFESFPKDSAEQLSLVRFRLKKTVPFEMESAAVSYQVRSAGGKKVEVLVAVAAVEIVARYEAPFRAAGFVPGFLTTSTLAALDLLPPDGLAVVAKLSGRVLTIAVCESRFPKLMRTIEMDTVSLAEVMGILFPTIAYAEDELPQRPNTLFVTGFGNATPELSEACARELKLTVEPLRALWGMPTAQNAGLLGYMQAQEANS